MINDIINIRSIQIQTFFYPAKTISTILSLLLLPGLAFAQTDKKAKLLSEIQERTATFSGKVGFGCIALDFKDTLLYNDTHHYPMQSVYKVPLAIYILDRVEQGVLKLDQEVVIKRKKLEKDTWSPMLKNFKGDEFRMSVSELLRYTVSKSDNNACDLLFELAGGTKPVNDYFQNYGVHYIAIAATEAEMHANWEVQYTNWCQPSAMLKILAQLYSGTYLNETNTWLVMQWMTQTENSPNRIRGQLPNNAVIAHKTGTGNTNKKGICSATNDVGIVTLPDGRHYALVVYLNNYKEELNKAERLIAYISKMIWDYYSR